MERARAMVRAHAGEVTTGDATVLENEFAGFDSELEGLSDEDREAYLLDLVVALSRVGAFIAAFPPKIVNGVAADTPDVELPAELLDRLGSVDAVLNGTFMALERWENEGRVDSD
jgi:hypothetical protein